MQIRRLRCSWMLVAAVMLTGTAGPQPAQADGVELKAARAITREGSWLFWGAGLAAPLLEHGPNRQLHTRQTAEAVLATGLLTEALKVVVREPRPDSPTERTSFPSGHASVSFALATLQSHYHPSQAVLWYTGATLIAASRVMVHRHRVHDVVAGAALGYLTSRFVINHSARDRPGTGAGAGAMGLQLSRSF